MSKKKPAVAPTDSAKAAAVRTPYHDWLAPLSDPAPCGPDLEYDHDFVVLFANAAPRQDVQYGAFVGAADPVNWSEVERDCRRLMLRTKDIRVAVLYTRCRTRLAGASGLAEGTGLLTAWLHAFADHVHPQPDVDGEYNVALEMRRNALQALADPEGLLADVREIVLAKSTVTRLQVRDVERAFVHPKPADALAPDSVAQQLQELRIQQRAVMVSFDEALANLAAIGEWCTCHIEGYQPDLSPLERLLSRLGAPASLSASEPAVQSAEEALFTNEIDELGASPLPEPVNAAPVVVPEIKTVQSGSAPADRQAALALIRAVRTWFEAHEPSSPIPVLLKRAEQFAGKRYAEVVRAIPPELIVEWEKADGS
jgi:type VI secretion system protein ImpA